MENHTSLPRNPQSKKLTERLELASLIIWDLSYISSNLKLTSGNNHKEQYRVNQAIFEQRHHCFGDWLNLKPIKSAAKRYKKKHDIATANITTQPANDSVSPGSSTQPPCLDKAPVVTGTDESFASDLPTVTADASPPH